MKMSKGTTFQPERPGELVPNRARKPPLVAWSWHRCCEIPSCLRLCILGALCHSSGLYPDTHLSVSLSLCPAC